MTTITKPGGSSGPRIPLTTPEPIIAAIYKFLKFMSDNDSKDVHENWALLGGVRNMLGQKPGQMDYWKDGRCHRRACTGCIDCRKSYTDMRVAIEKYLERWGIV